MYLVIGHFLHMCDSPVIVIFKYLHSDLLMKFLTANFQLQIPLTSQIPFFLSKTVLIGHFTAEATPCSHL